ncbi:hypothetical protein DE146DRAFT_352451 [Phaeosphaeria sp. MPI-PUGE-AT-0046c]|nr:hypothetical protein DE146DRAFT_352451 [Phaeosphaeria sp. MPI-PUGE-AT-0046c]
MSLRPLLRLLQPPSPSCSSNLVQISLMVRPSTHSSRQGITAVTSSHVALNVSAPAIDGRANAAVAEVLARALEVAKSDVRVVKGEKGKEKVVEVEMRGFKKDGGREGLLEKVKGVLEGAVVRNKKHDTE